MTTKVETPIKLSDPMATKKIEILELQEDIKIVDNLEELKRDDPKKKFYFQQQKCMLTYGTHIPKEEYKQWFENEIGFKPKTLILAHEIGLDDPEKPYYHTHVLVDFGKRFQTRDQNRFDYKDVPHCMIQPIKYVKHWTNSINYMAKEDPENAYLLKPQILPEQIMESLDDCITAKDVVTQFMKVKPNGDVNWTELKSIVEIKKACPTPKKVNRIHPRELQHPWQMELKDKLSKKSKGRKIRWIYDTLGGIGKSTLVGSLCAHFPKHFAEMALSDLASAGSWIQRVIEEGWVGTVLFVDIAKSEIDKLITGYENNACIYRMLEKLVDGKIFAKKYQSKMEYWNNGHIVVFANEPPKYESMSKDRWIVKKIDKNNPKDCDPNSKDDKIVTCDAFDIFAACGHVRGEKAVSNLPALDWESDLPPDE